MTFFFDHSLSARIARALNALKVEAVALQDEFCRRSKDTAWSPVVAGRGWIIVTADQGMWRRPNEHRALARANAIVICIPSLVQQRKRWAQAQWFLKVWPQIVSQAERAAPATWIEMHVNGSATSQSLLE